MRIVSIARSFDSFWRCGIWAAVFGVLLAAAGAIAGLHLDAILVSIVAMTFWILLLLASRRVLLFDSSQRVAQLLAVTSADLSSNPFVFLRELRDSHFSKSHAFRTHEVPELSATANEAEADLTTSSHVVTSLVDDANDEISCWYGPLQALVWSLPALGFLGMAWHLRGLVALATHRSEMNADVALAALTMPLTSALLVVCLALATTAVAHVATALALREDMKSVHVLRAGLASWLTERAEAKSAGETRSMDALRDALLQWLDRQLEHKVEEHGKSVSRRDPPS